MVRNKEDSCAQFPQMILKVKKLLILSFRFCYQMPRNYTRKTEKNSYSQENLKKALDAIKTDGRPIREVGRCFNIPESTLRKKLSENCDVPTPPRLGRKSTFSVQEETALKDYVITLAKLFYGLTPKELRRLAFRYAEHSCIKHDFNQEKSLAGKDWLYGFLKRNPHITLRQPEGTSLNRISAFNEEEIKLFFSNLQNVMDRFKFEPSQIYNMDETGVTTVQKNCPKIYGPKGMKRIGAAISAERGRTITAVFAVNVAGSYIPPMLIYPRKRMTPQLQKNGPMGCSYKCSKNGWINAELFSDWLIHFQKYAKPTQTDPVLLILDNHSSHISIESYEFCRNNFIHMVSLPPHTSHRLQPLDLTFFSPLKNALYREYDLYLSTTAHEKITEYELAELLNKAFVRVATMEKAASGFRSAGIFPLNPDKFQEHDFAPANEVKQIIVQGSMEPETPKQSVTNFDIPNASNRKDGGSRELDVHPNHDELMPSTSAGVTNSVLAFSLIPKDKREKQKVKKSGREKQHSEILTSTPVKQKLEERQTRKIKKKESEKALKNPVKRRLKSSLETKINKKKKQKKQQLSESSESSIDDPESLCDDDELDDIDLDLGRDLDLSVKETNELCGICGETGKDRELWYRCVFCSAWNHAECAGVDTPKNYLCDFCKSN